MEVGVGTETEVTVLEVAIVDDRVCGERTGAAAWISPIATPAIELITAGADTTGTILACTITFWEISGTTDASNIETFDDSDLLLAEAVFVIPGTAPGTMQAIDWLVIPAGEREKKKLEKNRSWRNRLFFSTHLMLQLLQNLVDRSDIS